MLADKNVERGIWLWISFVSSLEMGGFDLFFWVEDVERVGSSGFSSSSLLVGRLWGGIIYLFFCFSTVIDQLQ